MQRGQAEGAIGVLDVAEDTAGADRGELLIIAHQSDTPTPTDHELDSGIEGQRVSHPGLVNDHQGRRPDPRSPIRQITMLQRPGEVSLVSVSERMPVCSPRTAAAAADGASPTTPPPSWVQAKARARIAVVFPAPAGRSPAANAVRRYTSG